MITYEWIREGLVAVFLEGKRAGKIRKVFQEEWVYFPKGNHGHGEPFATLDKCKKSIETE